MATQEQLEEPPPYLEPATRIQELPKPPMIEPAVASPRSLRYDPLSYQPRRSRSPQTPADSLKRPRRSPISPRYSPSAHQDATKVTSLVLPQAPKHDPSQVSSPPDSSNAMNIDQPQEPRATSASIEDPDDRMAAEALCGLGKVESNISPKRPTPPAPLTGFETPLQYYPIGIEHTQPGHSSQQSEPLLSLLTTSHPWLGGTLHGSLSAYSSTKSYTPRFVQRGADIVENTVGSVGRVTGVEGSIRRYLEPKDRQRPSDIERPDTEMLDRDNGGGPDVSTHAQERHAQRKTSQASSNDSLPLYDDNRSPAYSETTSTAAITSTPNTNKRQLLTQNSPRSWSSQLMISTSGLGAALNEASLRSLKTCLALLSNANTHLRALMEALKRVIADYDAYLHSSSSSSSQAQSFSHKDQKSPIDVDPNTADAMVIDSPNPASQNQSDSSRTQQRHREAEAIASRIRHLNAEIWATLKAVVNTVSRHTGGALPENASLVVRWQLLSVPTRWKRAVAKSSTSMKRDREQSSSGGAGREVNGPADSPKEMKQPSAVVNGDHQPSSETENHPSPSSSQNQPPPASATNKSNPSTQLLPSAHAMLAFAVEGLEMMEQVGGVVDSTIASAERWLDSFGGKGKGVQASGSSGAVGAGKGAERVSE